MCGITAVLNSSAEPVAFEGKIQKLSALLRHRGPDWSGSCIHRVPGGKSHILAHERLTIVDPLSKEQPLFDEDKNVATIVNGEIYNHKALKSQFPDYQSTTESDSEVIIPMFKKYGSAMCNMLDGIFAFVVSNEKTGEYLVARDPIGVIPLYIGKGEDGSLWIASEMKAIVNDVVSLEEFPPGSYLTNTTETYQRWYNPHWVQGKEPSLEADLDLVREKFEDSVIKRLMCDVPYGLCLSGGLDSSLVASIVTKHFNKHGGHKVHSFSVGLVGSPDLKAAKEVADYLGTNHHEFTFTFEEAISVLRDVIYKIETYDVPTIRASMPMYLLSKRIKELGIKMVLSGEGSDEIFGGYLYFHKAPTSKDFHEELCRKVKMLSKFDCMRANKSTSAWGIEARVPFLDKDFLEHIMSIDATHKLIDYPNGKIEKYILRKAFDGADEPYLPSHILWRQKEQFSDGVGYNWVDCLKDHANEAISDSQFDKVEFTHPTNTPRSKEELLYRKHFDELFPLESAIKTVPFGASIACSTPVAVNWDKSWKNKTDTSGRSIMNLHSAHKQPQMISVGGPSTEE